MNGLVALKNAVLQNSGPNGSGEEKATILSLVLAAAQDQQMEVRMSAAYCLGYFKDATNQVIPALSKGLVDSSPDVRIRAAMGLYMLDPLQAEKAGAITTALECLRSNGSHGSQYLAAQFLKKEANYHQMKSNSQHQPNS